MEATVRVKTCAPAHKDISETDAITQFLALSLRTTTSWRLKTTKLKLLTQLSTLSAMLPWKLTVNVTATVVITMVTQFTVKVIIAIFSTVQINITAAPVIIIVIITAHTTIRVCLIWDILATGSLPQRRFLLDIIMITTDQAVSFQMVEVCQVIKEHLFITITTTSISMFSLRVTTGTFPLRLRCMATSIDTMYNVHGIHTTESVYTSTTIILDRLPMRILIPNRAPTRFHFDCAMITPVTLTALSAFR